MRNWALKLSFLFCMFFPVPISIAKGAPCSSFYPVILAANKQSKKVIPHFDKEKIERCNDLPEFINPNFNLVITHLKNRKTWSRKILVSDYIISEDGFEKKINAKVFSVDDIEVSTLVPEWAKDQKIELISLKDKKINFKYVP